MKKLVALSVLAVASLAILGVHARAQDEPTEVGRLHRIDLKAKHPTAYGPSVGDLIQCYLDFPIVPEQIVDNLEVQVSGNAVAFVACVNTSRPKIVGSGQVSAYLQPLKTGTSRVTIRPDIPGQKPRAIELRFDVQQERRHSRR